MKSENRKKELFFDSRSLPDEQTNILDLMLLKLFN